jgi:allantoinase
LPISAETCPHYLTFVAEEIPDGAAACRCDPPIRERENREYLWASLAGGLIQLVASNHPHVSSVQQSLAATWTEARLRGYSLNHLVDWMCRAPAQLAALDRKGTIDVGFDADLTIWNPELECAGEGAYAGRQLFGVVERTYLRGARVYARGQPTATAVGRVL